MYKKLLTILLLFPLSVSAQYRYNPGYWTADIVASSSSFLSDLGGKNADGTNDFMDLDLNRTRYAFGGGFTYHIGSFGLQFNSFYTRLSADDALSKSSRTKRQLSVRTDLVETSLKLNYIFPHRFPVIGSVYFSAGAGFIYYEPKAEIGGTYYKLRPLGTEGQNYLNDRSQYSSISPVIPFSVGKKFQFTDGTSFSIELSMRKTFTDYLDDVSTDYADASQVAEKGGAVAGALSDRSDNRFETGDQRGDPTNMDNYFLIGFKYSFPLGQARNFNRSCAISKPWATGGRSRRPGGKFGRR